MYDIVIMIDYAFWCNKLDTKPIPHSRDYFTLRTTGCKSLQTASEAYLTHFGLEFASKYAQCVQPFKMASALFQDETDEPSPAGDPSNDAGICQDDSANNCLFQDELDDPKPDNAPTLFQAEPDEPFYNEPPTTPVASFLPEPEVTQGKRPPMLFEDDPDEASDSECSTYNADDELRQPREKSFVNLSFSTVSQYGLCLLLEQLVARISKLAPP